MKEGEEGWGWKGDGEEGKDGERTVDAQLFMYA